MALFDCPCCKKRNKMKKLRPQALQGPKLGMEKGSRKVMDFQLAQGLSFSCSSCPSKHELSPSTRFHQNDIWRSYANVKYERKQPFWLSWLGSWRLIHWSMAHNPLLFSPKMSLLTQPRLTQGTRQTTRNFGFRPEIHGQQETTWFPHRGQRPQADVTWKPCFSLSSSSEIANLDFAVRLWIWNDLKWFQHTLVGEEYGQNQIRSGNKMCVDNPMVHHHFHDTLAIFRYPGFMGQSHLHPFIGQISILYTSQINSIGHVGDNPMQFPSCMATLSWKGL